MKTPIAAHPLALLVGLLASACSPSTTSDPLPPDPDACSSAGMQQSCLCGSALSGTQVCGANLRYGSCTCPAGKRVFVTSTSYSGNLMTQAGTADGLAGGDKLCQQAAQAAVLGGTWKAWLSAPGMDAKNRIADVGPWYLLNGTTRVFHNAAGLTTTPLAPINMTEQKVLVPALTLVWTGTDNGGVTAMNGNCTGWTMTCGSMILYSVVGDANSTSGWTSSFAVGMPKCTDSRRLYCFEQ